MTVATKELLPAPTSLLTALRDVQREPASSMEEMRRAAKTQAGILRKALPGSAYEVPERLHEFLHELFPSIVVEEVADVPVAGLSYWSRGRWHIQVRRDDSMETRTSTMLHQLKCVIDHPLRQRSAGFSAEEWDGVAEYFARHVLNTLDQISA